MDINNQFPQFFLAASSPVGFASKFSEFVDIKNDRYTYIIKGGPGTGKSTFMNKLISELSEYDTHIEKIYCSSDPDSLDGVIFHDLKVSILDGTAPHVMDPKYVGAYDEIIPLSECLDYKLLYENRDNIKNLTDENKFLSDRSNKYLSAIGSIVSDTNKLVVKSIDIEKIARFTMRVVHRELKPIKNKTSKVYNRFLSGITPQGVVSFDETANVYCDRIYVLYDEYSVASNLALEGIKAGAMHSNYDVIVCYCPMDPNNKIDHIFIPEAGIGFMTCNKYHELKNIEPYRSIHCRRFCNTDILREYKQRLSFNKKAVKELLDESIYLKSEAKKLHDYLEKYYIKAMDFKLSDKILEKTVKKIINRNI